MNLQKIAAAATVVGGVATAGVALFNFHKIVKTERQKREEIKLNTERELLAIHRAGLKVQEKIMNGDYRPGPDTISTIMADMQFYRLADRFEE
jgi:hypothetical protein